MLTPQLVQHTLLALTFFFLITSFSRKFFFACAYLLVMMNRPGLYYPILGQIRFELIVAVWAVIIISMGWSSLTVFKDDKIVRSMWIFLLICMVSMLQAFSFFISWDWVYDTVLPNTLIILLILMFCKEKKEIKFFLWIFIIASIGLGYEAVYNYITGDVVALNSTGVGGFQFADIQKGRAENHNAVANYFLSIMPLLWYTGVVNKKIGIKIIGLCLFALSFYGVLISGSRGGMVGLVVLIIVMALFSKRSILFLTTSLLLLVIIMPFMGARYLDRMATILDVGGSDMSASNRITGLVNGIEMMIKRPLLGVGPGCYPVARKAWFGWSLWAHNHYGQLAGELGMTGLVVWFLFAKNYIKRSWQLIKTDDIPIWVQNIASAVFVTSIVRLVLGMSNHSLYHSVWFIMAATIVVVVRENENNSIANSSLGPKI